MPVYLVKREMECTQMTKIVASDKDAALEKAFDINEGEVVDTTYDRVLMTIAADETLKLPRPTIFEISYDPDNAGIYMEWQIGSTRNKELVLVPIFKVSIDIYREEDANKIVWSVTKYRSKAKEEGSASIFKVGYGILPKSIARCLVNDTIPTDDEMDKL